MAITKIGVYRNPPEDITDFQGINELLMAYARDLGGQGMILTEWTNTNEWPKLAMGSYLFHGGASYMVDTEDYTIGAPGNGTYYLKIEADGETLTVSWASSLSGYAWNPIYNGLYHPDQSQILPYQLVVSGATKEKWKITNLAQGGGFIRANWQGRIVSDAAINVSHVNTGDGNFKIGQNLRTTDAPTFATINTGQGNFKIGQNLRTTDAVIFATVNTGYGVNEVFRQSYESITLANNSAQSATMASMEKGELRYLYVFVNQRGGFKRLYLPSGGQYFVQGWTRPEDNNVWESRLSTRQSPYHGPAAGILNAGTTLLYMQEDDESVYIMYIIKRIDL